MDGYVQFLIHTAEPFRDLVEASIYAQYPDAEIVEVEDYVNSVPQEYPNDEYNMWATELILVKDDCYPIRTYLEFEHSLSQDMKDPMAALLEIMSKFNPGEQAWFQIIIVPINQKWTAKSNVAVRKIIKEEMPIKKGPLDAIFDGFLGNLSSIATGIGEMIIPGMSPAKDEKKKDQYNIVQNLTEGDKEIVSGIQKKATKIGYKTKMRLMYIAKNEVFLKQRGVSGIFGAIKQFNTNDKNAIKPETKKVITKVNYFFKKKREAVRKTKIMKAYKERSISRGTGKTFIFNIEELATLWHFPMIQVKAPLIKKAEVKKVEPPFNLPTENIFLEEKEPEIEPEQQQESNTQIPVMQKEEQLKDSELPSNLPFE